VFAPQTPSSSKASQPSLRGTIVAAVGAITSLGCAAAIGLASTTASSPPTSPADNQPVQLVQPHAQGARP
jgi:hypothetical protein